MDSPKLVVTRFDSNDKQTLSWVNIIESGLSLFCFAGMELPDKGNIKQFSCIPKGIYDCIKVKSSPSIPYDHISILNVPNRDGICIHKANFSRQLKGCLAIGSKHVDIDNDGLLDISESGKSFAVLMRLMPDKFKIEIK